MAEIARDKCLASGIFDKIIISSDDPYFKKLINCNKVDFLQRKSHLTDDNATTDVVVDFLFENFISCESILWVNSVSPLQSVEDIKNCGLSLNKAGIDCVMAINTLYQHCCISHKPINFNPQNSFEMTQNLEPIQRYLYSCMGWKRDVYVKNRKKGFKGLFPGNLSLVEVSSLAGMLIKYEEDFVLCSKIDEALDFISKVNFSNHYMSKQNILKIKNIKSLQKASI